MPALKIVFMGTPDFAVESLKKIVESSYEVVGVVTSVDKEAGRGLKIRESAVKKYASQNNLNILQPTNLKDPDFIEELKLLKANLFVVVAFRMLPEVVWNMPELGTINLHASLLPNYRGAAPINWAIINGEKTTGVSTFIIQKEIDTGKVILQKEIEITEDDTAGDLHDKLMNIGSEVLVDTVKRIEENEYKSTDQNEILSDLKEIKSAPKIFKENCKINWNYNTDNVYNFIRGLSPFPCAWTEIIKDEKMFSLKIFDAQKVKTNSEYKEAGEIITDNKTYIQICTNDGVLAFQELQIQGKKRMKVEEFLRGYDFTKVKIKMS